LTGTATARCLVVDDDPQVGPALARVIEAHGRASREVVEAFLRAFSDVSALPLSI
jgi:hypothetical protein